MAVPDFDEGAFAWKWVAGGIGNETILGLQITSRGGVYALGKSYGAIDYNAAGTSTDLQGTAGKSTIFLTKINALGTYEKTRLLPGYNSRSLSLIEDNTGNLYIAGSFSGTIDFNTTNITDSYTSVGSDDIYITKYFADGLYAWTQTMGGTSYDFAEGLSTNLTNGDIYMTGTFRDTVDFDSSIGVVERTAFGQSDVFLLKMSP